MAETYTSNLELVKPDYDSPADIFVINSNMDKIDEAVANAGKVQSVNGQTGAVNLSASDVGALPLNGTAADSAKLGGKAPEYYIQPRNLLDNSDFTNPVNQRGVTSWTNDYGIDRWLMWESTATPDQNGLQIGASEYNPNLQQRLKALNQKNRYTAVICDSEGNLTFGNVSHEGGLSIVTFHVQGGKTYVWAALYEGSYTADTLPPYVPKGYAAELAECQRYYYAFCSDDYVNEWAIAEIGFGDSSYCIFHTGISQFAMRTVNLSVVGNIQIYDPDAGWANVEAYCSSSPGGLVVRTEIPSALLNSGNRVALMRGLKALSADLL